MYFDQSEASKSKMANGVWKGVYPLVFGRSRQLSLNKFFDPSTPSMRKVDDGEKRKEKRKKRKKIMTFIVATNVIASRPPKRRPTGMPHARAKITLTQPPHLKPYCGGTPKINGMYCCETLNALSFKWSSWDEAYGPKEQPETIKQLITLT